MSFTHSKALIAFPVDVGGGTLDYKFIPATAGLPQGEIAAKVVILFILG